VFIFPDPIYKKKKEEKTPRVDPNTAQHI
jgi:hypothetical protein